MTTPTRRSLGRAWLALLVAGLAVEGWALFARPDGTLTSFVRELLASPLGRCVGYGLWSWLTWHWFLTSSRALTWRDALAVAIGVAIASLTLARGIPRT